MSLEELAGKAFAGLPMPENLCLPDQWIYLALRSVYYQYTSGFITKEQAEAEKRQLREEYQKAKFYWQISLEDAKRRNRLSRYFSEMEKDGCEKCRLALRIFDGRESGATMIQGGKHHAHAADTGTDPENISKRHESGAGSSL